MPRGFSMYHLQAAAVVSLFTVGIFPDPDVDFQTRCKVQGAFVKLACGYLNLGVKPPHF